MHEQTKKDCDYLISRKNNPLLNQNDSEAKKAYERLMWTNLNGLTDEERKKLNQATSY